MAITYFLHVSGYTSVSNFTKTSSHVYFPLWEALNFTIQVTRVQTPSINQPANALLFDGRLRSVSMYFRLSKTQSYLIIRGGLFSSAVGLYRENLKSEVFSESHWPQYNRQNGSFWSDEFIEKDNQACENTSLEFYPGCLDSPDKPDNSSITVNFPLGLATPPNGFYGDGIISLLRTKFNGGEPEVEFDSPLHNFALLFLSIFLVILAYFAFV